MFFLFKRARDFRQGELSWGDAIFKDRETLRFFNAFRGWIFFVESILINFPEIIGERYRSIPINGIIGTR